MTCSLSEFEIANYLKYAKLNLPRHTSYPAVPFWQENFTSERSEPALAKLQASNDALSLYIHVPYCRQLCFYCACNKEIIPDEQRSKNDPSVTYLQGLFKELRYYAERLRGVSVQQIHLGGGTPTFLHADQLRALFAELRAEFSVQETAEIATEIDPRVTSFEHLKALKEVGCNRLSLGVQDFSPVVQKAINRIQSFPMVEKLIQESRSLGYTSINFDLIYGLPFQTLSSMEDMLSKTLALQPDRIAYYRLAMMPEMFKWQKAFGREHLPSERENIQFFLLALNTFVAAGYEFVGLDHFAKKDERLVDALENKTLRRNFQGMTTGKPLAIIGMGPAAVSQTQGYFWQNLKKTSDWLQKWNAGETALAIGFELSLDDRIRQDVIETLYCYGAIHWHEKNARWGIDCEHYFAKEIEGLKGFMDEEIVLVEKGEGLFLTPVLGRMLVRLVAAQFDRYLKEDVSFKKIKFSQVG